MFVFVFLLVLLFVSIICIKLWTDPFISDMQVYVMMSGFFFSQPACSLFQPEDILHFQILNITFKTLKQIIYLSTIVISLNNCMVLFHFK